MAFKYYLEKVSVLLLFVAYIVTEILQIPHIPIISQCLLIAYYGYWVWSFTRAFGFYYGIGGKEDYLKVQDSIIGIWGSYGTDTLIEASYDTDATIISYTFYLIMSIGAIMVADWLLLSMIIYITTISYLTKLQIRSIVDTIIWDVKYEDQEELY
jgi:hypothetical protein